jgi:hypothetical protein
MNKIEPLSIKTYPAKKIIMIFCGKIKLRLCGPMTLSFMALDGLQCHLLVDFDHYE